MSRKRHRSRRPKDMKKRRILNSVKEEVVQMRALGLTYNDIADKTNLGYGSVEHILRKWSPQNPKRVKAARARAMEEMAEQIGQKTQELLGSITQDSMTHDRVEQFNARGDLVSVQHSGPNAPQLVTAAAIMIDKGLLLQDTAAKLKGEQPVSLGPTDFAQLITSIGERVTRLSEVNADINTGEIQARVIELTSDLDEDTELPADYEVIEEE